MTSRIMGNGVEMTQDEKTTQLMLVVDRKTGAIIPVEAVKVIADWFERSEAPILFQATGIIRGAQQGYWRYWNGRYWAAYNEVTLMTDLDWMMGGNMLTGSLNSVISTLRTRLAVPFEKFDTKPIVVFRDRVLQVENNEIATYKPGFVPEDLMTTGLDITPTRAAIPTWKSVLNLLLPNKQDQETLQELFGYAFFPAVSLQVFFLLHGDGGTGKDTVISVLKEMIGEERVSAVPLCSLGKGHANEGLIGKILNINMEAESVTEEGELSLKMITGDSPIQIDPKHKPTFTLKVPTKFVLAANKLPRFQDRTEALWERYVTIPFNTKVRDALEGSGRSQIRIETLLAQLRPEFDGILLWGLAGLKRVLASGKVRSRAFTQSEQAKEQITDHKIGSNSFLGWLDECAELVPMALSPKTDAYDSYKLWCADSGYPHPLGKHNFGKELKRKGVTSQRPHRGAAWYVGVKIRNLATEAVEMSA